MPQLITYGNELIRINPANYFYTRPGSEDEKKWQAAHPEGTFVSK